MQEKKPGAEMCAGARRRLDRFDKLIQAEIHRDWCNECMSYRWNCKAENHS